MNVDINDYFINKDNTSIPIIVDGVEEFHPFIMERNASGDIIVENVVEDLPKIVEESIPTKFISIDNQKIIREQIESAKQDARQYAINIKRKKNKWLLINVSVKNALLNKWQNAKKKQKSLQQNPNRHHRVYLPVLSLPPQYLSASCQRIFSKWALEI